MLAQSLQLRLGFRRLDHSQGGDRLQTHFEFQIVDGSLRASERLWMTAARQQLQAFTAHARIGILGQLQHRVGKLRLGRERPNPQGFPAHAGIATGERQGQALDGRFPRGSRPGSKQFGGEFGVIGTAPRPGKVAVLLDEPRHRRSGRRAGQMAEGFDGRAPLWKF